jgi:hypothetical protein
MKIKHIAAHIALIASFGMAAGANAQLLGGGGGLSGSLGGMVGGAGNIGGQIGGAGSMGGRGSLINDVRPTRSIDNTTRRAEANGAGQASGDASGSASGGIHADLAGSGRQLVDGARAQVESTRGYARSTAVNGARQAGDAAGAVNVSASASGLAAGNKE